MKNNILISFLILIVSCSKKNPESVSYPDGNFAEPKYDTTPIDSFSVGATSVDIARKIRMSSYAYQDSLKKVAQAQEEIRKQKEAEEKLKKEAEKTLEKNKEKETPKSESPKPAEPKPSEVTAPGQPN